MPKFWLGDKVRVNDPRSYFNGLVELVHGIEAHEEGYDIFQLYTPNGERWFAEHFLEAADAQPDAGEREASDGG